MKQQVFVVLDLIYGEEGNPGIRIFLDEADAIAEENRLLADDPCDGTYLVIRTDAYVED